MRVSIITPVLNGAKFLNATLDSVEAQSYPDWQHFVMDGGSTDGTLEILERRAAQEPRLTYVSRPDDGQYDALLAGFDQAADGLIGWLNADDIYAPWAVEEAVRNAKGDNAPRWISGLPALWDAAGCLRAIHATAWRPRSAIRKGYFHDDFLGCLQQEAIFFHTSLFQDLTEAERECVRSQRLAGDFALWRAFAERSPLVTLPVVLGGFRVHAHNRSVRQTEAYQAEIRALGGPMPARWLARRLRTAFELVSSARNVWAFRKAALELSGAVDA
ncbi:glycosyltransferase [Hyphomonas sp.]|uniref:glycosyltransferase n=1 Tax=Hyphomonas sp. TaxID=87 RepID=UPI003F712B48